MHQIIIHFNRLKCIVSRNNNNKCVLLVVCSFSLSVKSLSQTPMTSLGHSRSTRPHAAAASCARALSSLSITEVRIICICVNLARRAGRLARAGQAPSLPARPGAGGGGGGWWRRRVVSAAAAAAEHLAVTQHCGRSDVTWEADGIRGTSRGAAAWAKRRHGRQARERVFKWMEDLG